MPRLLVMSDLHIEFGDLEVPDVNVDVVVLAGDIHVGTAAAQWSEDLARCLGVTVVLIAGNHEHYRTARTLHGSMKQNLLDCRAAGTGAKGVSPSWSARPLLLPAFASSVARFGRISAWSATRISTPDWWSV